MTLWRGLRRDRRGVTSLEFAIVGSGLIAILMFITVGSLMLWASSALQVAATQTARCVAIASPRCADPSSYATGLLSAWGVSGVIPHLTVTTSYAQTCNVTAGHYVSVSIVSGSGQVTSTIPGLDAVSLSATACFPTGV
jgi:Flp pilus assembly pilin Flp